MSDEVVWSEPDQSKDDVNSQECEKHNLQNTMNLHSRMEQERSILNIVEDWTQINSRGVRQTINGAF